MIAIQCALRSLAQHTETEWSTRNNRNKYRRAPPKLAYNLIHLRLTRFGRPQFVNEELLCCRKVAIRGRGPFIWVQSTRPQVSEGCTRTSTAVFYGFVVDVHIRMALVYCVVSEKSQAVATLRLYVACRICEGFFY